VVCLVMHERGVILPVISVLAAVAVNGPAVGASVEGVFGVFGVFRVILISVISIISIY